MVLCPWGGGGPQHFQGMNFYLTEGRQANPARRIGLLVYLVSLVGCALAFSRAKFGATLSSESPLSKWFLCVACLVAAIAETFYRFEIWPWTLIAGLLAVRAFKDPRFSKSRALFSTVISLSLIWLAANFYALLCLTPSFLFLDKWPVAILEMEAHSAYVICIAADRLAAGVPLFSGVICTYGVFFPTLLALYQRTFGTLNWGEIFEITGALHMMFIACAGATFWKYSKCNRFLTAVATLLLIPALPVVGLLTYYPNIAALRYFGFVIACLFLLYVAPKLSSARLELLSGLVGGLCFLMNMESGFCISFGFLLYLLLRRMPLVASLPSLPQAAAIVGRYVGGVLLTVLCFEILIFIGFEYWISPAAWLMKLRTIFGLASSGSTSNGNFDMFVVPLIIAVHSGYIVVKIVAGARSKLESGTACRAALAAMNLVWLIYFFNTPRIEALTANYFLYLFPFMDMMRSLAIPRFFKHERWKRFILAAVVFVITVDFGFRAFVTIKELLNQVLEANPQKIAQTELVSGIRFSRRMAEELQTRAAFIKTTAQKTGKVCYLTNDSILIPKVSGVLPNIPMDDIFFSLKKHSQNIQFVDNLAKEKVSPVYVDAPNLVMEGAITQLQCVETYRMLLKKYYRLDKTVDGWQVWVLNEGN